MNKITLIAFILLSFAPHLFAVECDDLADVWPDGVVCEMEDSGVLRMKNFRKLSDDYRTVIKPVVNKMAGKSAKCVWMDQPDSQVCLLDKYEMMIGIYTKTGVIRVATGPKYVWPKQLKGKVTKREFKSFSEAKMGLDASENEEYKNSPPIDGPENKKQYFAWSCKLSTKSNGMYIFWEVKENFFYIEDNPLFNKEQFIASGFAVKKIKKKYKNLQVNKRYSVVGRYIGNTQISLSSGESKTIPILTDVYIY
jgi:hypothetical protein